MHYINPEVVPITNEVFSLVNQYCKSGEFNNPRHTFIYFKKLKEPIVGQCGFGFQKYSIQLDTKSWNSYGSAARFELLVHEIGHCSLGLEHSRDEHNYMYESMTYLTKDEIIKQFTNDLKTHCQKKVLIYE